MGCFDTLKVACPRCQRPVEFQSKAGRCSLAEYTIHNVPPVVAGDLHGESGMCPCGATVTLRVTCHVYAILDLKERNQ